MKFIESKEIKAAIIKNILFEKLMFTTHQNMIEAQHIFNRRNHSENRSQMLR